MRYPTQVIVTELPEAPMEDRNHVLLQDVLDQFLTCFHLGPTSVVCAKTLHLEHNRGHRPRPLCLTMISTALRDHVVSQVPDVCRIHGRQLSRVQAHFVTWSGHAYRLRYRPSSSNNNSSNVHSNVHSSKRCRHDG